MVVRVALISTPFFGVGNRDGYGGLEIVVADLWSGLLGRGHKVVCFSPDPTVVPDGGFHISTGPALSTVNVDWVKAERDMFNVYDECLDDFDVTHGNDWFGFEYLSKKRKPSLNVCHTHHGGLNMEYWGKSKPPFKLNFIAISKWMKSVYENQWFPSEWVYNPVDLQAYPYQKEKGDRLMFLGRIDPIKAPHVAINVSTKTSTSLDIIGGTSFVTDKQYVEKVMSQSRDAPYSFFKGEVDHATKLEYLQNAKALLIPSRFGEPFGLCCVEALSCGTPVIALNDGALSEIIEHGKNGFICNNQAEMVDAVSRIDTINPRDCRARAEFFSVENCAKRYEELYKRILSGDSW